MFEVVGSGKRRAASRERNLLTLIFHHGESVCITEWYSSLFAALCYKNVPIHNDLCSIIYVLLQIRVEDSSFTILGCFTKVLLTILTGTTFS